MKPVPSMARSLIAVTLVLAILGGLAWWFFRRGEEMYPLQFSQAYGTRDSALVQVAVGSCLMDVTTEVVETATEVRIGASIYWDPANGCPDILEFVPVRLESPLRDRDVIDTSTGRKAMVLKPEFPQPPTEEE